MDLTHVTEEEQAEALDGYRWALTDALSELGSDATREAVISRARKMLGDDEPDQFELIAALSDSDSGDPVWTLEEEIIDDEETVPSGELSGSSGSADG